MSGNYPPGVTGGEDYFNPPDHSHEHEWEGVGEYPVFEDRAAIFSEVCYYHEGPRHNEWVCEERRHLRCDVDRVVKIRDGKPNVSYLFSENDHERIDRIFEEALELVEWASKDELEVKQVDPPSEYRDGYVKVRIGDYEVIYSQ